MQDPKADQIHAAAVLFALRSVAIFEAAKAILFLLLGCGVVDLIHNSVDAITEKIALMLRTRAIDRTPVALRNRGAVGWNSTLDWTMIRTAVDRVISATGVIFAVASELAERRCARYKHCHRSNDVKFLPQGISSHAKHRAHSGGETSVSLILPSQGRRKVLRINLTDRPPWRLITVSDEWF